VLALDLVDRLETALEQFREVLLDLGTSDVQTGNPGLPWHHSLQKRF